MHGPAQIVDSTIPRPINCIFALEVQFHHSEAAGTARRLLALFQGHQQQVRGLGRLTSSALRLMDHLQRHPVTTATAVAADTGMSFHTAQKMFAALQPLGIVTEGTGRKYGRFYTYTGYLDILNEGT